LYTPETFSARSSDASALRSDLARLGDRLGLALTPERIAVPKAEFLGAQMLAYDDATLGQIAYVDAAGNPLLFCIYAQGGPDAPPRRET
ncbi:hypothetical protein J8J40_29385, partial [Mycobacterium tuberculosis]|nr:hypothetical protein [Mycobacterium tuberculosis]